MALLVILAVAKGVAAARAAPTVGEVAPALIATELNGHPFDLAAERGKVVIINFWATWCAPCRAEMPILDSFYQAFRHRGLVLVGISVDSWADRDKVKADMRRLGFPTAMLNAVSANGFGVPDAIPVTYVVGRGGVLRAILRPDTTPMTPESLARIVLPLLGQKPPAGLAPGNMSTEVVPSVAGPQSPWSPGRSRSGRCTVAIGPFSRRIASMMTRSDGISS
jgi:cytochrome c biogenesis protein CcmG, thiol:disulfide interchange protein DsbE